MRLGKLSLAACVLAGSGIAAAAVEMTKPFEALEQSRRFMIELDKRQEREGLERQAQEKEKAAKRKREEAEQRQRERAEKARQEAQRKRNSTAVKAAQGAPAVSPSLQPQPSTAPTFADKPDVQVPTPLPQASTEAAESQSLLQNAPPARPQVDASPPTAQPPTSQATSQPVEHSPQAQPKASEAGLGVKNGEGEPTGRVQSANSPAAGASGIPNSADAAAPAAREYVAVSRVKRMNLYNDRGDKLGDVERVLQSSDGTFHIVIGTGGFLGIRERDVRIPLKRVSVRRDRLVIEGLTDDQLQIMPVFDGNDRTYRDLARNITVPLVREQSDK